MTDQSRIPRMTLREAALYAVLAALMTALASGWMPQAGLASPDSYMRLVRLRQLLADPSQPYVVVRDASGFGTVIHWSHLLDAILWLVAAPLSLFVSPQQALDTAAMVLGPLSLGAAGIAVAWAVRPFADRTWLWLAPLCLGLSGAVADGGIPGVVHHHNAALVLAIITAGLAARICCFQQEGHRQGWLLGACAGLGIWLTPETIVASVMALGAVWISWVGTRAARPLATAIRNGGFGLFITVTLAWLADPPYGGYLAEYADGLSIVFVALGIAVAAFGTIVILADEAIARPLPRFAITAACGVMIATIWVCLYPCVGQAAEAMMGSADWLLTLGGMGEMKPPAGGKGGVAYILASVLSIGMLAYVASQRRQPVLWYATVCAAGVAVLGWNQLSFAAWPAAVGSAMLPVAIADLSRRVAHQPLLARSAARIAVAAVVLAPPLAGRLPPLSSPAQAASGPAHCNLARATMLLDGLQPQVVLTDVDDSPELLYRTGMLTVGSLFHRSPAGFLRLWSAWQARQQDTVPLVFGAANISLVLFCPERTRPRLASDEPSGTVMDRLSRDDPPRWLARVGHDAASGYTLYSIRH